jgi:hypothetical protein
MRPLDGGVQIVQLDEAASFPSKIVIDHRWCGERAGNDDDTHTLPLQASYEWVEIVVAGKQEDHVNIRHYAQRIDGKFDVNVALYFSSALTVVKLFGGLCLDCEAVVVEPVDKRTDSAGLADRVVKVGAKKPSLLLELCKQELVINFEAERFCRAVEIGAVDKQRNTLLVHFRTPQLHPVRT